MADVKVKEEVKLAHPPEAIPEAPKDYDVVILLIRGLSGVERSPYRQCVQQDGASLRSPWRSFYGSWKTIGPHYWQFDGWTI